MTIFPNPSQRKLAGFCFALVTLVLGSIATHVALQGSHVVALFTAFVAANVGEHFSQRGQG